jgi:hypothetical protein
MRSYPTAIIMTGSSRLKLSVARSDLKFKEHLIDISQQNENKNM